MRLHLVGKPVGFVVGGTINIDADRMGGIVPGPALGDGGGDIDGGQQRGAVDHSHEYGFHGFAVGVGEGFGTEHTRIAAIACREVVDMDGRKILHDGECRAAAIGKYTLRGQRLKQLQGKRPHVDPGNELFKNMAAGIFASFVQLQVEGATRNAGKTAGLHVDNLRARTEVAIELANVFVAFNVGGVGAGAEDKANIGGGTERLPLGESGEQGGNGVVENDDLLAGDTACFERGEEPGTDLLADQFGNLDLLRPVQQAAIVVRKDGGRVGKAKAYVFEFVLQRTERVGEYGIEFSGRLFIVAPGHRLLAESRELDFALGIETGNADA